MSLVLLYPIIKLSIRMKMFDSAKKLSSIIKKVESYIEINGFFILLDLSFVNFSTFSLL